MKKMKIVLLILVLCVSITFSQTAQDSAEVIGVGQDYIGSWYTADGDRMANALHPLLAKKRIIDLNTEYISTYQGLIDGTNAGYGLLEPGDPQRLDVAVLDISGDIAVIKVLSNDFFDYICVAKLEGQWKAINVLWDILDQPGGASYEDAVSTANDYINCFYDSDGVELEGILDYRLAARTALTLTTVREFSRESIISETTEGVWSIHNDTPVVEVLDVYDKISLAKIEWAEGVEYLQIATIDGEWEVIHILWEREYEPSQITSDHLIQKFSLNQNFPNPFNPETLIAFNIPNSGNVVLNIYNVNGQLIRTLVDGFKTAGNHSVKWDGRDALNHQAPSGIYFYQLKNESSTLTKHMLLIK